MLRESYKIFSADLINFSHDVVSLDKKLHSISSSCDYFCDSIMLVKI